MDWKKLSRKITDLSIRKFSEEVTFHFSEEGQFTDFLSKGVYDSSYTQVDLSTGAVISSNSPMIEVSARDIPKLPKSLSDQVTVRSARYKIKDVQTDESGAVKILLTR